MPMGRPANSGNGLSVVLSVRVTPARAAQVKDWMREHQVDQVGTALSIALERMLNPIEPPTKRNPS